MVSIWPWRSDDSSPASFAKTLSVLSGKIAATQTELDKTRASARRAKVLWILYLSFAYLVYAIVVVLVVGYQKMKPWEWTGVAGGPVFIYLVRKITNTYYTFRVEKIESRLKDQQAVRAVTIQKLKEATKYDSTLELLEKYGGEKPGRKSSSDSEGASDKIKESKRRQHNTGPKAPRTAAARTNMAPPPTANIRRNTSAAGIPPIGMAQAPSPPPSHVPMSASPLSATGLQPTAEFAPNADGLPIPHGEYDYTPRSPSWYDRLLDAMLGEDEASPKNRIVLICRQCRLVNGQAPPGTRSLAEVGLWRCMGCHAENGAVEETKRSVREVLKQETLEDEAEDMVETVGSDGDNGPAMEISHATNRSGKVGQKGGSRIS